MAISTITRRAPALMPTAYTGEVLEIFERNPDLDSVVLTEYGAPVGLVSRTKLYERLSRQYGFSLYTKRPVRLVMDDAYLAVDARDSIDEVARKVVHRRRTEIYDEVVVLENGVYSGVVSVRDLLHTMTEFQASVNRYSNPLTGLPGRTLVQQEIERRANGTAPYALLHVDINHFRSYNERHGYGRGDEVIKALAECLATVTKEIEGPQGLVGHLGGVNFVVLCSEKAAEPLGLSVLERFERRAAQLHISREVSLLGADVRSVPPEIELSIAGVTSTHAQSSPSGGFGAKAAQYKRTARTMRGSAFVLDGRVVSSQTAAFRQA
ncbi:MAG TPA: GGDEF domain-containing protein [Candidatus Eremiobacteraceae bacterium]|nr:GGDEF domain-containing protein [Candidatus Eremiobacteraceae bacterium]